jgi:hypothetical protein
MAITSGHIDDILNATYTTDALASVDFVSGTAANGAIGAITVSNIGAAYPGATSLQVTSITDATNTAVFAGSSSGGYYGGGGTIDYTYILVGASGNNLLFTDSPITAAQVASDIQNGTGASLDGKLFVLSMTDSNISSSAQSFTFSALAPTVLTVALALSESKAGQLAAGSDITDSAVNVQAGLDSLQSLAAAGKIAAISLTDSGFATLTVSPAQLTSDATVLGDISGNFVVDVTASAANVTISGLAGHGNTAVFGGTAGSYSFAPAGDGVSLTVTGNGSVDHLSNFNALQFSDQTVMVAPTPGSNGAVTGGNVTELYGAVFGRLPDVPGLAFYEAELKANPSLSLTSLAQNFLQSPEYTGNSAHAYAQTAAGEAQFVTDSYNNLLHRTPESGAIPYYQNLISQFTQGLTPGTAAYANADLAAHATVLVDFSASAEFLNDVQITAQNPASGGFTGHWLVLI